MFVPRCALVDSLVMFSLLSADIHNQSARVGPHAHIGVLFNVKVSPVSRPRETKRKRKTSVANVFIPDESKTSFINY